MRIYKFLLDHFTDEQRFSITTKISHSILGKGLSLKIWQRMNWCLYKTIRLSIQLCYLPVFTGTAVSSKILLLSSLCVPACFVDKVLPLDLEASELLSDTFAVLSCKEIKLSTMRSKPDEDIQPDEDEMAMANAVMQVAQKKLISQVNGTWSGVGRGLATILGGILPFCDGETCTKIIQVT